MNTKQAYAASVAAKIKPQAVFIPLDILNHARKNYTLTHLVDELRQLANMDLKSFEETAAAGKYKTAFAALERSHIEAHQTDTTTNQKGTTANG